MTVEIWTDHLQNTFYIVGAILTYSILRLLVKHAGLFTTLQFVPSHILSALFLQGYISFL
jgi:hypothetical protein